jgi:hypothetical protein
MRFDRSGVRSLYEGQIGAIDRLLNFFAVVKTLKRDSTRNMGSAINTEKNFISTAN